jgi:hypothetical protein
MLDSAGPQEHVDNRPTEKSQHRLAAEEVFAGVPLRGAVEERAVAINWAETAALHLSNEEYWRKRALDAEEKLGIQKPEFVW